MTDSLPLVQSELQGKYGDTITVQIHPDGDLEITINEDYGEIAKITLTQEIWKILSNFIARESPHA